MIANKDLTELQAAITHHQAGRLSDAAKIFKRLLQRMPGNFGCVYSLAMIYAQQQNFGAAAEMFRHAAELRPDLLDAHYNLAVALSMAGNSCHRRASMSRRKLSPRPHPYRLSVR